MDASLMEVYIAETPTAPNTTQDTTRILQKGCTPPLCHLNRWYILFNTEIIQCECVCVGGGYDTSDMWKPGGNISILSHAEVQGCVDKGSAMW